MATVPGAGQALAQKQGAGLVVEMQQGDPALAPERLAFDPAAIGALLDPPTRGDLDKRMAAFDSMLLSGAQEFLGFDRDKNETEISAMLALFRLPFRDTNLDPIPFCAAGVSYVSALAYWRQVNGATVAPTVDQMRAKLLEVGQYHFYPTPSVRDMHLVAQGTRRWRERTLTPKPGWLVVFAWDRKATSANHVGIVESYDEAGALLHTIEFNTSTGEQGSQGNGGHIVRRTRAVGTTVNGYIDTSARSAFS